MLVYRDALTEAHILAPHASLGHEIKRAGDTKPTPVATTRRASPQPRSIRGAHVTMSV